jgi:hypothetical protein
MEVEVGGGARKQGLQFRELDGRHDGQDTEIPPYLSEVEDCC